MHVSELLKQTQSPYLRQVRSREWAQLGDSIRSQRQNACAFCQHSDKETQIHHLSYDPAKPLAEYPSADFLLLCQDCHSEMLSRLQEFRRHVFRHLRPEHLRVLNGALAVGLTENDPLQFVYAVASLASFPRTVEALASDWVNDPDNRGICRTVKKAAAEPKWTEVLDYANSRGFVRDEQYIRRWFDYWTGHGWHNQQGQPVDWQMNLQTALVQHRAKQTAPEPSTIE